MSIRRLTKANSVEPHRESYHAESRTIKSKELEPHPHAESKTHLTKFNQQRERAHAESRQRLDRSKPPIFLSLAHEDMPVAFRGPRGTLFWFRQSIFACCVARHMWWEPVAHVSNKYKYKQRNKLRILNEYKAAGIVQ